MGCGMLMYTGSGPRAQLAGHHRADRRIQHVVRLAAVGAVGEIGPVAGHDVVVAGGVAVVVMAVRAQDGVLVGNARHSAAGVRRSGCRGRWSGSACTARAPRRERRVSCPTCRWCWGRLPGRGRCTLWPSAPRRVAAVACIWNRRGRLNPASKPEAPSRSACRRVQPGPGIRPIGMRMCRPLKLTGQTTSP